MGKQRKKTKVAKAQVDSKQSLISYGARKVPPRQHKLLAILCWTILYQSGEGVARSLGEQLECCHPMVWALT